jgi:putative ABC transport system ATP-binding protein
MLELRQVTKAFIHGGRPLTVLKDITLHVSAGAVCALLGPSGSGKSTLLALSAGLERPSSGSIVVDGCAFSTLSEEALAEFRNERIGFIFQAYYLIPTLTARENVMVPAELRGARGARSRATELLERVGLADRADHYPNRLSGGEQQRVAIARAYINQPKILFGDEPTGNLDAENAANVEELLFELNRTHGSTLVLATHNVELAAKASQIVWLRSGEIEKMQPADAVSL